MYGQFHCRYTDRDSWEYVPEETAVRAAETFVDRWRNKELPLSSGFDTVHVKDVLGTISTISVKYYPKLGFLSTLVKSETQKKDNGYPHIVAALAGEQVGELNFMEDFRRLVTAEPSAERDAVFFRLIITEVDFDKLFGAPNGKVKITWNYRIKRDSAQYLSGKWMQ